MKATFRVDCLVSWHSTPVEYHKNLWQHKTTIPTLSCGFVCVCVMLICLAVLTELWHATDGQTDRQAGAHTVRHIDKGP